MHEEGVITVLEILSNVLQSSTTSFSFPFLDPSIPLYIYLVLVHFIERHFIDNEIIDRTFHRHAISLTGHKYINVRLVDCSTSHLGLNFP